MTVGEPVPEEARAEGVQALAPDPVLAAVADRPSAYIPGDRRRALASGTTLPNRVHGAALFADISGFTPLTEALSHELGSQRASEVLTGHLNRVFHAVIAELDGFGGEVIYFSGDAITCWLGGDDGSCAAAAGMAMQSAMRREGAVTTPGGLSFHLALKVAVAVGPARRFVVGDPEIQLLDVLAGGLVDLIAETEHLTETGEVVLHQSALSALEGKAELGAERTSAETGSVRVVDRLLTGMPEPDLAPAEEDELPGDLARPWLLPAVYERLSTGRGEFLAELRPAYPMFVSFGGIDYDTDEAASEKLDEFVRAAQRVLAGYGGNVLQLTLGDKGAYLYGVFGTPHAHEDDAARACAAALELRALEATCAVADIRIGITHGRLRSGTYGHARRRTFVCLGDSVNLAARLMSKAPAGEIYVSELVRRSAGDSFSWVPLEPLVLKGKSAPVTAFSLSGVSSRRSRRVVRYNLPLIGRSTELAALNTGLDAAIAGEGRVIGISAEAGMGKSRLVAEFVRASRSRGLTVAFGECQSYGTSTGYFVWREIWRTLFGLPEHASPAEQIVALEQALGEIDEGLVLRAPLLDAVLGVSIPDNDLTGSFDAKLRKASLEYLLADCLRAQAARAPVVIVLEDCHWLDSLSRDLLEVLVRAAHSEPVLLVAVYRPEAALPQGLALAQLHRIEEHSLAPLDEEQMEIVVRWKLGQLVGEGADLAPTLRDLVVQRAQGNPFYAEEVLNYVFAQGVDPSDELALRSLDLPESLHSLILSRIDTLTEAPRRTLKVASVVGRVFQAPMLPGVYPELGTVDDVRAHLGTLRLVDLVNPDREDDESYLFKHAVTQEVAYESLPYALRAELHACVGSFLEHEPGGIDRNLDLLAHHYWLSDDEAKKRTYLQRAAAAAQASYANSAAIDYYERLVTLLPDAERVEALLELGKVLELVGRWDAARASETAALELAEAIGNDRSRAWSEAALAEIARKQASYDEASERLARAAAAFELLGEESGLGRVLHLEGNLAFQRGDFAEARSRYEQSLEIGRRSANPRLMANVLSNLGMVAGYSGEYELAQSFNEQALELRTELGDRWAIAVSNTNLGMLASQQGRNDDARARFDEAMRLNREVGDAAMIALTDNNLGNAYRGLRDFRSARRHYADSLRFHEDHDDQWALVHLLEDIARLAAAGGGMVLGLELLGSADTLREAIGSPRGEALEQEIAADVDAAAAGLGEIEWQEARARGRAYDRGDALEAAESFCARKAVDSRTA